MPQVNPYDGPILDHIKNARNYLALDEADHKAEGINPLCGDELTVYLRSRDGVIDNISFQCSCCGISMASASIMTESIKGQRMDQAKIMLKAFVTALGGENMPSVQNMHPDMHAILDLVRDLPGRKRCATLPWITLEAALEERTQAICSG